MSSMLVQRTLHFFIRHIRGDFRSYYEGLWKLSSCVIGNRDNSNICNGWMGEKLRLKFSWCHLVALETSLLVYMIPYTTKRSPYLDFDELFDTVDDKQVFIAVWAFAEHSFVACPHPSIGEAFKCSFFVVQVAKLPSMLAFLEPIKTTVFDLQRY